MASGSACTAVKIGIIGGTGLDDPEILEGRTEKYVDTPFGKPSDALILGKIKNVDCVLLARIFALAKPASRRARTQPAPEGCPGGAQLQLTAAEGTALVRPLPAQARSGGSIDEKANPSHGFFLVHNWDICLTTQRSHEVPNSDKFYRQ